MSIINQSIVRTTFVQIITRKVFTKNDVSLVKSYEPSVMNNDTMIDCMYDNKKIGYAKYDNSGKIISLYVEPDFRRKSVGSILLQEIEKDLKQKNINQIWIKTNNQNCFLSKQKYYTWSDSHNFSGYKKMI